MHPGSRVPWGCSAPLSSLPPSSQLCQNGGLSVLSWIAQTEKSRVSGGRQSCLVENSVLKNQVWRVCCRDATASSCAAKFGGGVLAHIYPVVVKHHSSVRSWMFECSLWTIPFISMKIMTTLFYFALQLFRLYRSRWVWTFRVRLMLYSPNASLITARVPVALVPRFAQNLMLFLCRIYREIASGQIHDSK
jgi:hypothetical protein